MTKDVKEKDGNVENAKDETLLLVKGCNNVSKEDVKEYIKKLSNAVIQTFYKHDSVKLRGVGAGAGNIADKAIIIAKEEVEKKGDKFLVDLSFTTVMFGDDPKTGILKKLVKIEDEEKDENEDEDEDEDKNEE